MCFLDIICEQFQMDITNSFLLHQLVVGCRKMRVLNGNYCHNLRWRSLNQGWDTASRSRDRSRAMSLEKVISQREF